MKITKGISIIARLDDARMVSFDGAIEIAITGNEAVAAILHDEEGWEPDLRLKQVLNNLASLLRGFSAETVASLSPAARKTIYKFLRDQAQRFAPQEPA